MPYEDSIESVKRGVEKVILKHRAREKGIKIIRNRIQTLEQQIEKNGNYRELAAEIRGLEFALKNVE